MSNDDVPAVPTISPRPLHFVVSTSNLDNFTTRHTLREVRRTAMNNYLDRAVLQGGKSTDKRVTKRRALAIAAGSSSNNLARTVSDSAIHPRSTPSHSSSMTTSEPSSLPVTGSCTSLDDQMSNSTGSISGSSYATLSPTLDERYWLSPEHLDSEHFGSSDVPVGSADSSLIENFSTLLTPGGTSYMDSIASNSDRSSVVSSDATFPMKITNADNSDTVSALSNHSIPTEPVSSVTQTVDHVGDLVPKSHRSRGPIEYDVAYGHAYGLYLDSLDPFTTMKPLDNPNINVELLKSNCVHVFGSKAMLKSWVPLLCQLPAAFLASLCLSAPYTDLMLNSIRGIDGNRSESGQTAQVLAAVPHMIAESLEDPKQRYSDPNIAAVLQLIAACVSLNYPAEVIQHRRFLKDMVSKRGGLQNLGYNGVIAVTMCQTDLEISVLYNERADTAFLNYAQVYIDRNPGVNFPSPEGPLYCQDPDMRMRSIISDKSCGRAIPYLLRLMYKLTNTAIEMNRLEQWDSTFIGPRLQSDEQQSLETLKARVKQIARSVHELHPAKRPGHSGFNDNCYEAIRLASLIYTHAIMYRVPFHRASHVRCTGFRAAQSESCLVEPAMVYDAITRTNIADIWDKLGGSLYWVLMIAAAASSEVSKGVENVSSADLTRTSQPFTSPAKDTTALYDVSSPRSDSAPASDQGTSTSRSSASTISTGSEHREDDMLAWAIAPDSSSNAVATSLNAWIGTTEAARNQHASYPQVQQIRNSVHMPDRRSMTLPVGSSSTHAPQFVNFEPTMGRLHRNDTALQHGQTQAAPTAGTPTFTAVLSSSPRASYSRDYFPAPTIPGVSPPRQTKRPRTSSELMSKTTKRSAPPTAPIGLRRIESRTGGAKRDEHIKRYLVANAVRTSIQLRFEHTTAMLTSIVRLVEVSDYINRRNTWVAEARRGE